MTPALSALTDSLTQAALLAALLERSLSLAFVPPHAPPGHRGLPAAWRFRLPLGRSPTMEWPLFETICLVAAFWLCAALPVAPLLPASWPPALSHGVSALFVTSLASGWRSTIALPLAAGETDPAQTAHEPSAPSRRGRLARLAIAPEDKA